MSDGAGDSAVMQRLVDRRALLNLIRNHYWHIRNARRFDSARRRRYYRKVAKIKAILLADGFDVELLRLYCRQLASLDRAAVARYEAYLQKNNGDLKKTLLV